MRNITLTAAALFALTIVSGGASAIADRDPLSPAPHVAPADKEKTPARPPKLLPVTAEDAQAEFKRIQAEVQLKPNDAQAHYKLGEAYRKNSRNDLAVAEYNKAISLDPTLWVAYHQLTFLTSDEKQLDATIEKLTKLEAEKPRELLLRVALSEVYEKRGNYYQAARTLVDCTYSGAVPEKWRVRVNARIHNMLVLSKSQKLQVTDPTTAAPATANGAEEELDVMPAPLPMPSSKRSLAQAKIKDAKEVRGMGNTPLLP